MAGLRATRSLGDWAAVRRKNPSPNYARHARRFIRVRGSVVDASTGSETALAARAFGISDLPRVESDLAAAVAGAVFRVALPAVPRRPNHLVAAESYRLTLEGWHELSICRVWKRRVSDFAKQREIDPTNARAFAGLSSVLASQAVSEKVPFDLAYDRASAAATRALALDSLEGTAWANLGLLRALRYNDLAAGAGADTNGQASRAVERGSLPRGGSVVSARAPLEKALDEITVARELDPFTSRYLETTVEVELCADRPDAAIRQVEAELVLGPANAAALGSLARSLARAGRYDDAIGAWRKHVALTHDAFLASLLDSAHGEAGYWSARHADGRRRLSALERDSSAHWTLPSEILAGAFRGW